jgi:hypothetical protein
MRAASLLLSSLSDFPATRRAWRRDAFELLLDPTFFAVDVETLRHWRNIIDNLMCHDKDAFREFLGNSPPLNFTIMFKVFIFLVVFYFRSSVG